MSRRKNFGDKDGIAGFRQNPQNINRKGRPKLVHLVNEDLKKQGYEPVTRSQVEFAYQTLLNLPIEKVKEIAEIKTTIDYPIIYKLVAKELLGKKGADYLEKILDRVHGKSRSPIDVEHSGKITIIRKIIDARTGNTD